jgi:hypothetical protein
VSEQSPELEVLDQLLGGDMTLDVLRLLFWNDGDFGHAIRMMLEDGDVRLIDGEGNVLPDWKHRHVMSDSGSWARGTAYRLSITERGARRV